MHYTIESLLKFIIGFAVLAAVPAKILRPRITGESSSTIDITSVPYQVAVEIDGNQRCGGSIISPNHVLSAAQCISWLTLSPNEEIINRLSIRAGSSIRNEGGSVHEVAEIFIHENYTGHRQRDDLVILQVSRPFEFDRSCQLVELFNKGEPIIDKSVGIVSGFGESRHGGSGELRAVRVSILKRDKCDEAFKDYGGAFDGQVCSDGGIMGDGPCGFDWGGPLIVNGRLAGIVTLALGCNNPDFPAVYTEIAYYRNWIDEKVGHIF